MNPQHHHLTYKFSNSSFLLASFIKSAGAIFLFLIFISFTVSAQEPVRVLFIGNSFTYSNNMPSIVGNLAQAQGNNVVTQEYLVAGERFVGHAHSDSVNKLIRQANYDYVVLQGFSRELTHSDDSIAQASLPYIEQLIDSIRHYNPTAIPMFYMTWGYKNGTKQITPFDNFDDMNTIIQQRYENLAQHYGCWVAPVGVAWAEVVHTHPEINLYTSDNYHPSLAGSYLAACTMYSMLFNKRCKTKFNAGLPAMQAADLQRIASNTVQESLYKWKYIKTDEPFDSNQYELFSNPAKDVITFYPNSEYATISVYNLFGKKVAHFENARTPFSISTEHFPSANGVYFVRMRYNNETVTRRLLIER